jgi:hypothetical protein
VSFYKDSESYIKIESIEKLYKLNFSNSKYDETQNIKILCYELILLFSRINLITFYRMYQYNFVKKNICGISKKIADKIEIYLKMKECNNIIDCYKSYENSIHEIMDINIENRNRYLTWHIILHSLMAPHLLP